MFSAKAILSLKRLTNQFLTFCVYVSIYVCTPCLCVCVCIGSGKADGFLYEAEECSHAEMTNWEI